MKKDRPANSRINISVSVELDSCQDGTSDKVYPVYSLVIPIPADDKPQWVDDGGLTEEIDLTEPDRPFGHTGPWTAPDRCPDCMKLTPGFPCWMCGQGVANG